MKKILQRYVASNFVVPFIMSTLFFVAFLLTFQLFRITRIIIGKGVPIEEVLVLVAHIGVSFLPMAIPLSALFATIFSLNRLSEDSEIVAMRSFGMSKWQLFTPLLILGLLIGYMLFSLNRSIIPNSKKQFKNSVIKLTSKGVISDITAENFFTEVPGVILFAQRVFEGGKRMENVFIHSQKSDTEEKVIFAQRGNLINQQGVGDISSSIRLHLENGNITSYGEGQDFEKTLFQTYDFPLMSQNYRPGFVTKDSMRTNSELRKVMRREQAEYKEYMEIKAAGGFKPHEKHNFNNLMGSIPKTKLEYYSRLNNPFVCLLFILLGFSIGIKKGRGKGRNTGLIALIVLVVYYSLFFAGVSMARKNVIPAEAVVFVPTILLAIIGGYYFRRLDWA